MPLPQGLLRISRAWRKSGSARSYVPSRDTAGQVVQAARHSRGAPPPGPSSDLQGRRKSGSARHTRPSGIQPGQVVQALGIGGVPLPQQLLTDRQRLLGQLHAPGTCPGRRARQRDRSGFASASRRRGRWPPTSGPAPAALALVPAAWPRVGEGMSGPPQRRVSRRTMRGVDRTLLFMAPDLPGHGTRAADARAPVTLFVAQWDGLGTLFPRPQSRLVGVPCRPQPGTPGVRLPDHPIGAPVPAPEAGPGGQAESNLRRPGRRSRPPGGAADLFLNVVQQFLAQGQPHLVRKQQMGRSRPACPPSAARTTSCS